MRIPDRTMCGQPLSCGRVAALCLLAAVTVATTGPVRAAAPGDGQAAADGEPSSEAFELRQGDVVVFLGGEAVVLEGETGHLESLLTAAFPGRGVRYRNLAWEGDTVLEQPRDVNFPGVAEQLKRVGATVIIAQFGKSESFAGRDGLAGFVAAYEKFCDELAKQTPRIVLVTPVPFEKPTDPLLPDLSARNADLRLYVEATRALAERRGYLCVDLFTDVSKEGEDGLTDDGLRLTPRGAGRAAMVLARRLGAVEAASRACDVTDRGRWEVPGGPMEALRQAVVAKNQLWFDYWRPMNWAFLGGDRVFVQASRDHRDPNVRWFPDELERFRPLIEKAEARVEEAAKAAGAAQAAAGQEKTK